MSKPASISAGIAGRYATALFDLSKEDKALKTLESDVAALQATLLESPELRAAITSPVLTRDELGRAIGAIGERLGLSQLTSNTLALMARNRRLFALPVLLSDLTARIAIEKGEVTADVTSATKLTTAQANALTETLKASVGKTVKLNATVDESLIGGLVVKVGSKMIDTSIRSKLAALQNAMKEVG